MKDKKQALTALKIKITLLIKGKNQKELIPLIKEKYPDLNTKEPHIAMALNNKYPSMLNKIREVIHEV